MEFLLVCRSSDKTTIFLVFCFYFFEWKIVPLSRRIIYDFFGSAPHFHVLCADFLEIFSVLLDAFSDSSSRTLAFSRFSWVFCEVTDALMSEHASTIRELPRHSPFL